jgi:hypothetical protein
MVFRHARDSRRADYYTRRSAIGQARRAARSGLGPLKMTIVPHPASRYLQLLTTGPPAGRPKMGGAFRAGK